VDECKPLPSPSLVADVSNLGQPVVDSEEIPSGSGAVDDERSSLNAESSRTTRPWPGVAAVLTGEAIVPVLAHAQGLTLVNFVAQFERLAWDEGCA
jgi:hypothetical protein